MREERIRDYVIDRLLGSGGMGMVYLAHHEALKRPAAVKVLLENLSSNDHIRERFIQEARLLAGLTHPNIVTLYDFTTEPRMCLIMEYVDGRGLDQMIGQEVGPIPFEKALPLFKQILQGIGYAHSMGVIHRDIKPANILISQSGTVKITDLGIAKIAGQKGLTRTGANMGTLFYEAPEQIKGARDVDRKADIYSLGMTLYEMLAGRLPFDDKVNTSEFHVMSSIVNRSEKLDPRHHYPHIPDWLVDTIQVATELDADKRFSSCEKFLEAIESKASITGMESAYWSVKVGSARDACPRDETISSRSPSRAGSSVAQACPKCKLPVENDMEFCVSCGQMLNQECPCCSGTIRWHFEFCPKCGVNIETAGESSELTRYLYKKDDLDEQMESHFSKGIITFDSAFKEEWKSTAEAYHDIAYIRSLFAPGLEVELAAEFTRAFKQGNLPSIMIEDKTYLKNLEKHNKKLSEVFSAITTHSNKLYLSFTFPHGTPNALAATLAACINNRVFINGGGMGFAGYFGIVGLLFIPAKSKRKLRNKQSKLTDAFNSLANILNTSFTGVESFSRKKLETAGSQLDADNEFIEKVMRAAFYNIKEQYRTGYYDSVIKADSESETGRLFYKAIVDHSRYRSYREFTKAEKGVTEKYYNMRSEVLNSV